MTFTHKKWDVITHPFPKFNDRLAEIANTLTLWRRRSVRVFAVSAKKQKQRNFGMGKGNIIHIGDVGCYIPHEIR